MKTMILVHGACHGGWCWEKVTPFLEAEGFRALAPDLPDWPDDERRPSGRWGRLIADMAEAAAADGPVTLVGHSRGGMVISAAAEAAPDAVSQLIYLASGALPHGSTLTGLWREFFGDRAGRIVPSEDGIHFTFCAETFRHVFCPMADDETAAWAQSQLRPEPLAAMSEPLRVSAARFGRVPRAYIEASLDQVMPIEFQRFLLEKGPCDPVVSLPSDHSPFLHMPERLAQTLVALAR
jgi:pimeloyl-ACP methyl ester carboxylesterase